MKIDIIQNASEITKGRLAGRTAIVLDILRATSTIVTSLASGCREVVPVETVEEALSVARKRPGVILGGERRNLLIPGFHLGNSPLEYNREKVEGKVVVITTTNGTVAITRAAEGSPEIFIGSLLNARAVAREALHTGRDLVLVCAGTGGLFSLEDTVAAGIIAGEANMISGGRVVPDSDFAVAALRLGELYAQNPLQVFYDSLHGQKLVDMGLSADLEWCARLNSCDLVPVFRGGSITLKH